MIITIVQARMLSTRLPGKVMKEVLGKPLIGYMLERLKYSQLMDKIIVATSTEESNDEICAYVKKSGFDVFRGSEDNVLERYYMAAKQYKADIVVRMTADCPLTDPEICDQLIKAFIDKKADYACTDVTYAEGMDCEVFTFKTLETMYNKSTLSSEREHVSLYVHHHKELFRHFKLD